MNRQRKLSKIKEIKLQKAIRKKNGFFDFLWSKCTNFLRFGQKTAIFTPKSPSKIFKKRIYSRQFCFLKKINKFYSYFSKEETLMHLKIKGEET